MSGAAAVAPVATVALRSAARREGLQPAFDRLARRTISPLCGLGRSIGFVLRGRDEPRFVVAGAQLTGVEVLLGQAGVAYHIGGSGIYRDEAIIRSVGEVVERYAQAVAPVSGRHRTELTSYAALAARGERVVPSPAERPFTADQYAAGGFPFAPLGPGDPLTWVRTLTGEGRPAWAPAQLLFIGYRVRAEDGEPWLASAVTTGTAAHTDRQRALRGALLELVQLDAAMGHWYAAQPAPRIELDARTRAIAALVAEHVPPGRYEPTFHWLRAPGFDVKTVACVMRGAPEHGLGVAVGLGIDTGLEEAMYKALLEAVATVQLAKVLSVSPSLMDGVAAEATQDVTQMYDIDSNVAHYARPEHAAPVLERFPSDVCVAAGDLPPDTSGSVEADVRRLAAEARALGVRWLLLDCTTPDVGQLGFCVLRAWTPDLIALCMPSAPPAAHPRFAAYGGAVHARPHPYA